MALTLVVRRTRDILQEQLHLALIRDEDHYMPLLVSLLDIPGRINNLVQRIAPVDDRPDLPVLDQICEKHQILSLIHISEPTRLGMISYAVFCLKKKNE